jgi:hypothetical protein
MPTPSQIATVHRAMTAARGDRKVAADGMGIPLESLNEIIRSTPDLMTLWGQIRATEKTITEAYDRDRPAVNPDAPVELETVDISPRDKAISTAFHSQELKLQKFDWEGLGEKDKKTLDLMRQFEGNGVGRGVLRMMDAMQGGMAFCFMKVSRQFADVAEDLEKEMAKSPTASGSEKRSDERTLLLHTRFMDLAKEMQRFNKEATNAAHTRLLIADRAKKIQQASNRQRKPGWRQVNGPNGTAATAQKGADV